MRYSLHARRQMVRRSISEEEVEEALDLVGTSYPSADHPDRTVILGQTSAGRRLKVVVTTSEPLLVVTVAARDEEG